MEHLEPGLDDDPGTVALDPSNVLPRRIAVRAATEPDRPFLIEAASGRQATYGELWSEVTRWTRLLGEAGVRAGGRVATLLPSSIDAHAVWLACGLLGAHEVPVNPELRGEFLRHVLTDAAITVCVARPEFVSVIEESGVDGIDIVVAPIEVAVTASISEGLLPFEVDALPGPDGVSCVIYTSGTTGPAKGVVISWAQMSANIGRIPRCWLTPDDAVYSPWPMFHVTGRSPMMSMADIGGRVVLRERFSRADFWTDVRAHRCTSATIGAAVPLLLAEPERDDDADNPLRIVLFGKVGPEGRRFLDRFDATGISFYGSTEVGFPMGNRPIAPGSEHLAGRLRPGYEGRVVDAAGHDVALEGVGQLWIKPPDRRLILVEYLNQPDRTSNAIVEGWYRTGDAFRRHPDGSFEFVDRMGDTIRRFGENISSAALENAVMADCDVLECAAVGVASPVTGQDVLLLVIPRPGIALDPGGLAGRLADHLPRYMRPTYIAVVDELPRTPNGKIRKAGLAEAVDLSTVWQARR